MSAPLRIGVAGTGGMARTMIAAAARSGAVSVAGIASRTGGRAEALAQAFGLGAFASPGAMLADGGVEAVYVASEPAANAALAEAAIRAGKPVLVEKPAAPDADGFARLAELAAGRGVLLMEAIATPFLPAVAAALARAGDGTFGRALHLQASFGWPITRESHPVCFNPRGGGVLRDRMIYLVTLARLVLGPIARVTAELTREADGIDTAAALLLEHENGGTAQLSASFSAMLANEATIGLTGGSIALLSPLLGCERIRLHTAALPRPRADKGPPGWTDRLRANATLRRLAAHRADRAAHLPFGASPYVPELAHFAGLVRAGASASPVLPPALSLEVHRVLDEAGRAGARA